MSDSPQSTSSSTQNPSYSGDGASYKNSPSPAAGGGGNSCSCHGASAAPEAFVYAIGKLEVRFPNLGIEHEYAQLERQCLGNRDKPAPRSQRMVEVLDKHPHLARQLCYVLTIGAVPAYIVMPTGADVLRTLVAGLGASNESEAFTLVVGRRGPVSKPTQCSGVIAPLVACDTSYSFTVSEWIDSLAKHLDGTLKKRQIEATSFASFCREHFLQLSGFDNMGGTDAHRALNYVLMRHPGIALAALERPNKSLDQIESRVLSDIDVRRVVLIVLTFLDRDTGVPERLACRVDVTDEFPFVVGLEPSHPAPLGLLPYVDRRDSAAF